MRRTAATAVALGLWLLASPRDRADAFIVLTDPATFRGRDRIAEFAATRRLPAMYEIREFVEAGGLMAYGPSLAGMIERSVYYLEKILRGAKRMSRARI